MPRLGSGRIAYTNEAGTNSTCSLGVRHCMVVYTSTASIRRARCEMRPNAWPGMDNANVNVCAPLAGHWRLTMVNPEELKHITPGT